MPSESESLEVEPGMCSFNKLVFYKLMRVCTPRSPTTIHTEVWESLVERTVSAKENRVTDLITNCNCS